MHVYNREKGNQEAIITFRERVSSLVLTADGSLLVVGTEGGTLILWEIRTGRALSTSASHLRPVTSLAADLTSSFVVSSSEEGLVLVWSLLDLQSFSSPGAPPQEVIKPRHSLTGHSAPVTALSIGHSEATGNITISASADKTLLVWDHEEGSLLRTILLSDIPRCMVIDPADRATFVGFEDGSVQCVDFFKDAPISSTHNLHGNREPLQPSPSSRWMFVSQDASSNDRATLSLCLCYDGTALLSGHEDGTINRWDIGAGRFAGKVAYYAGAPITNLLFETPSGFPHAVVSHWHVTAVVKPRLHEPFSRAGGGELGANYTTCTAFSDLSKHLRDEIHCVESPYHPDSNVDAILGSVGVSEGILFDAASELDEWHTGNTKHSKSLINGLHEHANEPDVIMLEDDETREADETQRLRQRVGLLEQSVNRMASSVAELRKERNTLRERERESFAKRSKKERAKRLKSDQDWSMMARKQQEFIGAIPQSTNLDLMDVDKALTSQYADEDGSTTSESLPAS